MTEFLIVAAVFFALFVIGVIVQYLFVLTVIGAAWGGIKSGTDAASSESNSK